jgi:hypothetical protein
MFTGVGYIEPNMKRTFRRSKIKREIWFKKSESTKL